MYPYTGDGQFRCNAACQREGGHLYEPKSATEQDFVFKWVKEFYGTQNYYIGATCKYSYKEVAFGMGVGSKNKK